jgi:transcriptional regulator with XRE-family HTH domain
MAALTVRQQLGQRIKFLRESAKLTQAALSKLSDLPRTHICRIERGKYQVQLDTLQVLAEALDVSFSQLFYGVLTTRERDHQP